MIRKNIVQVISILVVGLFLLPLAAADQKAYDFNFVLPVPQASQEQAYLGVTGRDSFSLGDIQASIVLVEVFSMYCPICQREAEHVNQLFELIRTDENLNRDIRMLGIGAGNSGFEARFFKTKYNIGFPLFSDGDFTIHKKLKQVGTPHFFALKIGPDKQLDLVFSHSGEIPDPALFLGELVKASGLER